MPHETQLQFLEEMLGPEGIYYEAIIENPAFDLGTKSLYLERAVTQDCESFLASIDKLYDGSDNSLDLIRNLKTINDLCFNNQIRFGVHGLRFALPHFFSKIGPDPLLHEFQPLIQQRIQDRLTQLQQGQEAQVLQQRQARQVLEESLAQQMMWRTRLDLPTAQLEPQPAPEAFFQQNPYLIINTINTIFNYLIINSPNDQIPNHEEPGQDLTADEIAQLNPVIQQQILAHPHEMHQLTHVFHATFEQLQVLSPEEFEVIISHLDALETLVNIGELPFIDFLSLSHAHRVEFLNHPQEVAYLTLSDITANQLQLLEAQIRQELIEHAAGIRFVMRMEFITFPEIINMNAPERTQYLNQAQALIEKIEQLDDSAKYNLELLIDAEDLSFETLCNLTLEQLQIITEDPDSDEAVELMHPNPPQAPGI